MLPSRISRSPLRNVETFSIGLQFCKQLRIDGPHETQVCDPGLGLGLQMDCDYIIAWCFALPCIVCCGAISPRTAAQHETAGTRGNPRDKRLHTTIRAKFQL